MAARGISRRLFASQRKWKFERAFGAINDHSSTIRIILHEHNTCQEFFALSQQKSIVFFSQGNTYPRDIRLMQLL